MPLRFYLNAFTFRQIERVQIETQDKRVAMVTFGSEVHMLGDGNATSRTISGDTLQHFDALVREGQRLSQEFNIRPLTESYGYVSQEIYFN